MIEEIIIWKQQRRAKRLSILLSNFRYIACQKKQLLIERTAGNGISKRKIVPFKEHVRGKFRNEFKTIWYLMSRQSRKKNGETGWGEEINQVHSLIGQKGMRAQKLMDEQRGFSFSY